MKNNLKIISTTIIIFFVIIFTVSSNYYNIQYGIDTMKGKIILLTNSFSKKKSNLTIIDQTNYQEYIYRYNKISKELYHCSPFLVFKSSKDQTIKSIAFKTIKHTSFFKISQLVRSIKSYNALSSKKLKKNETIIIPNSLSSRQLNFTKKNRADPKNKVALYFTGQSAGSGMMTSKINKFKKLGINAVVFDAKNVVGEISYKSNNPKIRSFYNGKTTIDNMQYLIRMLKKNKIHTIARVAVFKDIQLAKKRPDLAIRSKSTGALWNKGTKELWCDPTNKIVQDYNIAIAIELSEMGIDEIQFDYIRFPTVGNLRDAKYKFSFGKKRKRDTITHFLKRAYKEISKRNTLVSIDIFGVVAWGKNVDIRKTGQDIRLLTKHCDIISPMIYPSHFNNEFDGIKNPADSPYHFISNGNKKVIQLSDKHIVVRPWLQAFKWKVSNYNSDYILRQIKGSLASSKTGGYLFWNAQNKYGVVYDAMAELNN